jgi:predicted dehydrogenase
MEIMTGRHDLTSCLVKRLVESPEVFGELQRDGPGVEMASMHHLEKLVDGAPLRRPWWFFDVAVQGNGVVDIPTHLVDQAQWLTESAAPGAVPALVRARVWSTLVPLDAFRRLTGEVRVPPPLQAIVYGDALDYRCNAQLDFRIGQTTIRASARWELVARAGAGDSSRLVAHGTRSEVWREQSARTGHRRRLFVEIRDRDATALVKLMDDWRAELPDVRLTAVSPRRWEIAIPPALDAGHESHFPLVLDAFVRAIDGGVWPAAMADRTLAKYALLAEAAARA